MILVTGATGMFGSAMTPEETEIGVICHFHAWRRGDAETCPDTYRQLTGVAPTSAEAWIEAHRDVFAQARDKAPDGPGAAGAA